MWFEREFSCFWGGCVSTGMRSTKTLWLFWDIQGLLFSLGEGRERLCRYPYVGSESEWASGKCVVVCTGNDSLRDT